jgi:hypothetical protein
MLLLLGQTIVVASLLDKSASFPFVIQAKITYKYMKLFTRQEKPPRGTCAYYCHMFQACLVFFALTMVTVGMVFGLLGLTWIVAWEAAGKKARDRKSAACQGTECSAVALKKWGDAGTILYLGVISFAFNTLKAMPVPWLRLSLIVHNFPDYVLNQLNTQHRRHSVDQKTEDMLKHPNPAKFSFLQEMLGHHKVVKNEDRASYPAPTTAKLLAIFLLEPGLLHASPMYEHWEVNPRYELSGGLLSNWFSDTKACRNGRQKVKVGQFSYHSGLATEDMTMYRAANERNLAKQLLREADKLGVSAELSDARKASVATFYRLMGSKEGASTIAEAIEREVFLAADGCDDGGVGSPYAKRRDHVQAWLAGGDLDLLEASARGVIAVLALKKQVTQRTEDVRSGKHEPRDIVQDLCMSDVVDPVLQILLAQQNRCITVKRNMWHKRKVLGCACAIIVAFIIMLVLLLGSSKRT